LEFGRNKPNLGSKAFNAEDAEQPLKAAPQGYAEEIQNLKGNSGSSESGKSI
jgi:hypothetical protein